MINSILEAHNLSIEFPTQKEVVRAVKNVSFTIASGETLGIVGESGSGKSVTSLAVIGLLPHDAHVTGEILFRNPRIPDANPVNLLALPAAKRRTYRGGANLNGVSRTSDFPQPSLHLWRTGCGSNFAP